MFYNYSKEAEMGLKPKLDPQYESIPDGVVLSPEQVGDLVGTTAISVRRWCRNGKLKAYNCNGRYGITGYNLKEFLRNSICRSKAARRLFYE